MTAANRHDVTQLLELVDRVAPVGARGKFRPAVLLADRAYDSRRHRDELRERGITRGSPSAAPSTARGLARSAG